MDYDEDPYRTPAVGIEVQRSEMISEQAVLSKLERQPKQTAGFKQLVRELHVHGEDRRKLAALLDKMVQHGQLTAAGGDRYSIPKPPSKQNLVIGRLSMHRDGYGFVIPQAESLRKRLSGDIFINPQEIGPAMHGDNVLVEIGPVRDGRAEGRILRVMDRAHLTVVGTFHYGSRYNYVTPMDEKITLDVVIPRGMEKLEVLPGKENVGLSRHRVLGAEAVRHSGDWEDLEGLVVDVEITDWPTPTQNPRGRLIEILGQEDDFGVDVEIVIRKYHLPHHFPLEALEEAQQVDETILAAERHKRHDFRKLPIVTIDGETARDFDDAVTVRRLSNGNLELQVHIADVAHYVTEDSALDLEARLRGNSVYFPDRAVPMLPVELSTNICSLRPNVDRLVMSCVMEIDHQGEIVGYELSEGEIRSAERMTYTDVNLILEGDTPLRHRYEHLIDVFELMRELATILNRKRVRRGSIDFDLPEPVIEFDENGLMLGITRSERNVAHRIIEEFMLAANECVASYLEQKGIASLYRIHEKPEPRKVVEFETIAASFGHTLGVGPLPVKKFQYTDDRRPQRGAGRGNVGRGGQRQRQIEIPEDIHITPRMYQKLAQKIAGTPEERILSFLMLRSLKQARYSEDNVGHFALAAPTYTHFTSPIRRYPDLIVHRVLKEVLRDSAEKHVSATKDKPIVPVGRGVPVTSETPSPWSKRNRDKRARLGLMAPTRKTAAGTPLQDDDGRNILTGPIPLNVLHEIAEECSESERRAADAERELMDWKKAKFMADRIGEDFDALIISVTKYGFFVELVDLFIEGLVPISTLTDDRYIFHDNTKQIIGQRSRKTYSLGDKVHVLVDRIDSVQKKIQFAVVPEEPKRKQRK